MLHTIVYIFALRFFVRWNFRSFDRSVSLRTFNTPYKLHTFGYLLFLSRFPFTISLRFRFLHSSSLFDFLVANALKGDLRRTLWSLMDRKINTFLRDWTYRTTNFDFLSSLSSYILTILSAFVSHSPNWLDKIIYLGIFSKSVHTLTDTSCVFGNSHIPSPWWMICNLVCDTR